ncbi:MAG: ParB/RepB/Spo0J family partition protein [Chloroflexi bacterium]|nr:ParB/RepB/Spo0J family partition protein [Chloroflexota bacterium]
MTRRTSSRTAFIAEAQWIALERIKDSARNPRENLVAIDELAASMSDYGLLQPVVLRPSGSEYSIIAGHRRVRAARNLHWHQIPAIVREADEQEAFILTLIENLQRADLTPREESRALELLLRERHWSTREIAAALKRSQAYVSKRLRVFDDPALAPLVLQDRLAVTTAEELLPAPPDRRKHLAELAVDRAWNATAARAAVREEKRASSATPGESSPSLVETLRALRALLKAVDPKDLQAAERREMRRVFIDLAMFAKSVVGDQNIVVPPLPAKRPTRESLRRAN